MKKKLLLLVLALGLMSTVSLAKETKEKVKSEKVRETKGKQEKTDTKGKTDATKPTTRGYNNS